MTTAFQRGDKVTTCSSAHNQNGDGNGAIKVLTLAEACVFLRISRPTMFSLLQRGDIPGRKVGNCWRFDQSSLISWLQGNAPFRTQRRHQ